MDRDQLMREAALEGAEAAYDAFDGVFPPATEVWGFMCDGSFYERLEERGESQEMMDLFGDGNSEPPADFIRYYQEIQPSVVANAQSRPRRESVVVAGGISSIPGYVKKD